MATLSTHGSLKIKNVNTKDIVLETNNSANTIKLKTHADSADYSIILPSAVPSVKEEALQIDNTDQTILKWGKILNYESGSDVSSASNTENNRIFVETPTKRVFYRIDGAWKVIGNWVETVALTDYSASTITTALHHETTVDRFYIATPAPLSAWQILNTTSYSTPKFVDIDSTDVTGHGAPFFNTNTLEVVNDSFTTDTDLSWSNGVIVLKDWVAASPAYIEWEMVSSGSWTVIGGVFGFVDKLITETGFSDPNQSNWGANTKMSTNNGINAAIGPPSAGANNIPWNHNDTLTNEAITKMGSAYNVEYGDRIQFFADPPNTSAEIVYIKNNSLYSRSKITGVTIDDLTKKCYYGSNQLLQKWRVSTNPRRYMGELVPSTYILNYS